MGVRACPDCGSPNSEFNVRCAACEAPLPPVSSVEPQVSADNGSGGHRSGSSLGRYRLLQQLGRGSMGTVWLAQALRGGRRVALKTVQVRSAALLPTLRREIRALERLRHPGIARILESGVQDGEPWYAMERIAGTTLRSWSRQLSADAQTANESWWTYSLAEYAPRPSKSGTSARASGGLAAISRASRMEESVPQSGPGARSGRIGSGTSSGHGPPLVVGSTETLLQRLTLVRRLCGSLAYMHGEGLVHRDLKPDNILIRAASGERRAASGSQRGRSSLTARGTRLGDVGWPVLVDFGLAAAVPGATGRESLELEGHGMGTALYMAPEQIRGDALDARADLYAFGCVLYELLAGRPPFVGADAQTVIRGHLYDEPLPPSKLAGVLPEGLDELVLRLLAKSPRERLGHAEVVGRQLETMGAGAEPWAEAPRAQPYLYRPGLAGREDSIAVLENALGRLEAGPGRDAARGRRERRGQDTAAVGALAARPAPAGARAGR